MSYRSLFIMPRCKTAATLKNSCITSIARKFESYWCAGPNASLFDTPRLLYVIGPFECLGSDLIHELLQAMVRLKVLRRHHLHLIIQPHLEHLNLGICDSLANHSSIVEMVRNRCQRLTALNLDGLNKVSPKALIGLLSGMPNLKSLNLKNTKCNDLVLSLIAEHCPLVVDLSLGGCPITDMGMSCLYPRGNHGCPNLVRLDVEANKVSGEGVAVLISKLPRLQWLQFPDLCYSLEILHREAFLPGVEVHREHTHQLKFLTGKGLRCDSLSEASVEIASAYCPDVTEIQLLQYVNDRHLRHLGILKCLKALEIGCQHGTVTFKDGIAPLLLTIGNTLTSLALHDVKNPDFSLIGRSCPILRKFTCSFYSCDQSESSEYTVEKSSSFSKLEDLFLIFCFVEVTDNTPESVMSLLLGNNKRLKSLQLFDANCLTDAVINSANERSSFPSLETVILVNCNRITVTGVSELIGCDNPLRHMTLDHCRQISIKEVDKLRARCKNSNFDIKIRWE